MSDSRSYLTVAELQQICEILGLPTDGLKHELIERILKFVPTTTPNFVNSKSSDFTRIAYFRANVAPVQSFDQSTQVSSDLLVPNADIQFASIQSSDQTTQLSNVASIFGINMQFNPLLGKFCRFLLKFVTVVGFFGGFYALLQPFIGVDNIEIPVKRSFIGLW